MRESFSDILGDKDRIETRAVIGSNAFSAGYETDTTIICENRPGKLRSTQKVIRAIYHFNGFDIEEVYERDGGVTTYLP